MQMIGYTLLAITIVTAVVLVVQVASYNSSKK